MKGEWFTPLWEWAKDWFVERDRRERDFAALPEDDGFEETVETARAPEPAFVLPVPIVNVSPKIGRNDPCPCGSGKKYKKCCGRTAQDHAGSGV
jgi:hypothetical protein